MLNANLVPGASTEKSEPNVRPVTTRGDPDVKVWVNTKSGAYHCPGTKWYGKTKEGEYMTQKQAQEKAYHPAYNEPCL